MRRIVLPMISVLLLAGCASSRSAMITEDTALVTVVGQSATAQTKIVEQALAEAAKITRAHGYRYFVILDSADASQSGVKVLQGQIISRQGVPTRSFGGTNLSPVYLAGSTFTTPDVRVPYVRLGLDLTIRMYREGDVNPQAPGVWNPSLILGDVASAR